LYSLFMGRLTLIILSAVFPPSAWAGNDALNLLGGPRPFNGCVNQAFLTGSPASVICLDNVGVVRTAIAGPVGGAGLSSPASSSKGVFPVKTSIAYIYLPISREEQVLSSAGKLSMAAMGLVQQPQNTLGFAALGAIGAAELWKVLRSTNTRRSEWSFIWSR